MGNLQTTPVTTGTIGRNNNDRQILFQLRPTAEGRITLFDGTGALKFDDAEPRFMPMAGCPAKKLPSPNPTPDSHKPKSKKEEDFRGPPPKDTTILQSKASQVRLKEKPKSKDNTLLWCTLGLLGSIGGAVVTHLSTLPDTIRRGFASLCISVAVACGIIGGGTALTNDFSSNTSSPSTTFDDSTY